MTKKLLNIPKVRAVDSTVSLMNKPYEYLSDCARTLDSDIFQMRLFGQKTVCLRGAEGAKAFYANEQALDDEHAHRKALIMEFMNPVSINRLTSEFDALLERNTYRWRLQDSVTVLDEMQQLLTEAACEWIDIPLEREDIPAVAAMLSSLFIDAGGKGPRPLLAKWNRHRAEIWLERLINDAREGKMPLQDHTPFSAVVNYRDTTGHLLNSKVCAVEILNLLRPIVSVSCYITFSVHALVEFPKVDKRRLSEDDKYFNYFIEEVRRYYPFFPAALGVARHQIEWQGLTIPKGTRLILDLYGMNHDDRIWNSPFVFMPERFANGQHSTGPHGAGELITVSLLSKAVNFFTNTITYQIPRQDLSIRKDQIPGLPRSGMRLTQIMLATPKVKVRPLPDLRDLDN
jgi:Cytochrome P450